MFAGDEQPDAEQDYQEGEAGDGEVGHFSAAAGRTINGAEHGGGQEPSEQESRTPDDGIGPGKFFQLAMPQRDVQDDAANETGADHQDRNHDGAAVDAFQPFQAWQAEFFGRREFVFESVRLNEIHHTGNKADQHGDDSQ